MRKLWFDEKYAYLQNEDDSVSKLLLARTPRLARATREELEDHWFSVEGVHWNKIDEDIQYTSFEDAEEKGIDLGAVPDYISISYLSQRFFGKSRSWLHNKLKGNKSNGKSSVFSQSELKDLKQALEKLSTEIREVAAQLP